MKDHLPGQTTLLLIGAIGLFISNFSAPAVAAEIDCGELAGRLKSGDDYELKLDLQSQQVRIEIGKNFCTEPAKAWFSRQFVLPQPANRAASLPAAALRAPESEIKVIRKRKGGNDAVALPGQIMRQGALPDLGFDPMGRETVPLPIQRASDKPKEEQATVSTDQPEQADTATAPVAARPTATVSGVRISNDPEGGEAKVTKYQATPTKPDSSTATNFSTPDGAFVPLSATPNSANGSTSSAVRSASSTAGSVSTGVGSVSSGNSPGFSDGSVSSSKDRPKSKRFTKCDRELTDFWEAGDHIVDGKKTNLKGVFTVDLDNDGRVDNVGFKIGAIGRIGNVLGYYPVAKGRLSARSVPTLKLDDEDDLRRLCSGDVTFSTMTLKDKQKAVGSAKRRQDDLISATKAAGKSKKPETKKSKSRDAEKAEEEIPEPTAEEKTENLLFWALTIAGVFFLLGGVGLFFAIRNMRSRDDEEEDEEDDDDDDDDDEEYDDDEEDDDEEEYEEDDDEEYEEPEK